MKRRFLILSSILTLSLISCKDNASSKVDQENAATATERDSQNQAFPKMKFDKEEHDFGTIDQGDVVEYRFNFTNTGSAPLVIVGAKGSCGCTVPEWPKDAIAAGQTGSILVKFNSTGKKNQQTKTVTLNTNTEEGKQILRIRANVTPKPESEKVEEKKAKDAAKAQVDKAAKAAQARVDATDAKKDAH